MHLPAVIADAFGRSRSEARRTLQQGGVKLDGEPVPAEPLDVPAAGLDGRVLQLGKRQFRRLRVAARRPVACRPQAPCYSSAPLGAGASRPRGVSPGGQVR